MLSGVLSGEDVRLENSRAQPTSRGGIMSLKRSANPVDVHVGSRVRLRRMALGMSQEKLGEKLGLTFQQIQKYEKGANRIGASRLHAIARILDAPIQHFFDQMDDSMTGGDASGETQSEIVNVSDFVSTSEGMELNLAFTKIKDKKTRRRLADLVRSVAEERDDRKKCT